MNESRMNYEMEIQELKNRVKMLELYIATLSALVNNINQPRNVPPVVSPGFTTPQAKFCLQDTK